MLLVFPVDLHLEILSYACLVDRLEYTRLNKTFCTELMTRIVAIYKEKTEFLTSESLRKKIMGLIITDPDQQLRPELFYNYCGHSESISSFSSNLGLNSLRINIKDFLQVFPKIRKLQRLWLTCREMGNEDIEDGVPHIPGLQKLTLDRYSHSSLPLMSLRKDDIPLSHRLDLRSLRYLMLHSCPYISDVSCLGHVYELRLIDCSSVVDISSLNHNEIIVIGACPVRDYSKSFRYSRVIDISLMGSSVVKGIHLNNLEAVQSLAIDFDLTCIDPLSYTYILPASLSCLTLKNMICSFVAPPNHGLKKIIFSDCYDISLQNIQNISFLKIHNYHGRASIDWSQLGDNKYVEISLCTDFKSGKVLRNVKRLTLINYILDHMKDLKNVTHLKLLSPNMLPFHQNAFISSTIIKSLFSTADLLQELEIEMNFPTSVEKTLLYHIRNNLHLKRIVIHHTIPDIESLKSLHQMIVKDFSSFYDIEMIIPSFKIILLSKSNRDQSITKRKNEENILFSLTSISFMISLIIAFFITSTRESKE